MPRLLDYYEEELGYLIEAGREFARTHPDRARMLSPDNPRARDPHVERLLEAFAFLAGRIRMRLDDDYPELTRSLLSLVWPHYLRPVPAMATLEIAPKEGMIQAPTRVAKGALVDSDPVGGRACRFRTAYDVTLLPLAVERAEIEATPTGDGLLRVRFRLLKGADPASLAPLTARLHLAGEPAVTYELYRLLTSAVRETRVAWTSADGRTHARTLPAGAIAPVGLGADETVLPADDRSFPGFRLLQEYFLFPEKFLYVDVDLDRAVADLGGAASFDVEFALTEAAPKALRVAATHFRLHCAPIVNLFERDAEPIRLTQRATEYRVIADHGRPDDFEVYEVLSVESIARESRRKVTYRPFHAFHHLGDDGGEPAPFYVEVIRAKPMGEGWDTYLSFARPPGGRMPEVESVSCRLTCTSGARTKDLRVGQIRHAAQGLPDAVTVRTITAPTRPTWPEMESGAPWRLIAHLGLNLVSLRDPATLRGLLSLYGETGERSVVDANRRRIAGVRSVAMAKATTMHRGTVVRGTEMTVEVQEEHFADRGDLRLFASTLAGFLALYASINSFVRLVVIARPSGETLRCPPRLSARQGL
jgi:type VI secretion system protein ImpG